MQLNNLSVLSYNSKFAQAGGLVLEKSIRRELLGSVAKLIYKSSSSLYNIKF